MVLREHMLQYLGDIMEDVCDFSEQSAKSCDTVPVGKDSQGGPY